MMIAMKSSNLYERDHRASSSSSSSGNKTPHKGDAGIDSSQMKKVTVDSLSQLVTVTANTTEMSSAVPKRIDASASRMSWQATNWDEMERCHETNMKASFSSRRASCKSESSASSFYQSLINEVEADELLRETSESSTEAQPHTRTKRKSMQKTLEEDEEAFANSLRALALEVEKKKEKDELYRTRTSQSTVEGDPPRKQNSSRHEKYTQD
mmetsp:Transcript_19677/g.25127  ORF Transcript_19677/g.25127 Transcript_19677/m.25127 type:complete len:211 (-) Transcript_19677:1113-1745(-)